MLRNPCFLRGISTSFVRCFEAMLVCLGLSWGHLGAILGRRRVLLDRLGQSWDYLGIILGRLEAILELSSAVLGFIGAILGCLEAILGNLGFILEPSWGHLGPS